MIRAATITITVFVFLNYLCFNNTVKVVVMVWFIYWISNFYTRHVYGKNFIIYLFSND